MNEIAPTPAASLPAALLVIVRLGGVSIFAPGLSSSAVPARVRVAVPILLGLAIFPVLASRGIGDSVQGIRLEAISLLPLVAVEIALGAVIGFLATLPLAAAQTGGHLMGQQLGLGFAQIINPSSDDETDIFGQLFFMIAFAGFILMGGLEHMMLAVMHSFDYVPLGGFSANGDLTAMLCGMLLASFELALRIAAPLLALLFLETIAMSFVAKTLPQLNILSLGFPVRILVGLSILLIGLAVIHEVLIEGTATMLDAIHQWMTSPTHHSSLITQHS